MKTNTPQTETVSNTESAWTTIRRKTTTRQTYGSDNKSFDTGKLTFVANMYACLVKEEQIESDRKTINACKILLRILHPQPVRKMISVNYAMHPNSKLGKGNIRFKLLRLQKRRTMNPTINTEYPTSALDKGKIGDKQTRLAKRNKSRLKEKKGGELDFVYNIKVPIPPPSQSTAELSKVLQKQSHPFTILGDFQNGSTQHSRKRREKRKREHDAKNGKQQKLQETRKSEGKEQPDADKKTGKKILHKQKIHRENIAPTVRIGHINPRGMLTPGKILSL